MDPSIGVSKYVFPALPILSCIGIFMLLFVLPGFIKTRSIPLILYILLVIYLNIISVVNTILWKNNIKDWAPVYCIIISAIQMQVNLFVPGAMICICRTVWIISCSRPMQRLHDKRRQTLIIDVLLCIIFPLVSSVLVPFSIDGGYSIIEGIGCAPAPSARPFPFVCYNILPILMSAIGATYCTRAIRNFVLRKWKEPVDSLEDDMMLDNKTRLLLLSVSAIILDLGLTTWNMILQLPIDMTGYWSWDKRKPWPVYKPRPFLEQPEIAPAGFIFGAYVPSLLALHLIVFFGFAPEAMKNYRKIWDFTTKFTFIVSARFLSCFKHRAGATESTPFTQELVTSRTGCEKSSIGGGTTFDGMDESITTTSLSYSSTKRPMVYTVDFSTFSSTPQPAIPLRPSKSIH